MTLSGSGARSVAGGLALAATGVVVGVALAFVAGRALSGSSATDPWTYGVVVIGLGAVAAVASFLPAWRATRVDPVVALHHE